MGGGGGLQATDLRRRLEFQCTGGTCSLGLRSLRHDSYHATEENAACDDYEDRRTDHEAILASGQPTCTGCRRSYRRQESEAVEKREILKRRMPESAEIGAVYRKLRLCLGLFEHASKTDEAEEDDEEKRLRLRWCRRSFRRIMEVATRALLLGIALLVTPGLCQQDAVHITAILGESVVFNCHVEFPGEHPVPYVLQWEKKCYHSSRPGLSNGITTANATLKRRIKQMFHVDGKYRGIVLHLEGCSIDWLAIETNCVKQGYCKPFYPLLRVFTKQVCENGIDFQEVSR